MRTALAATLLVATLAFAGCLTELAGPHQVAPKDYIQSKAYTSWVIEVDAQDGAAPDQAVLDFVKGKLSVNVAKPDGISFQRDTLIPDAGRTWNDDMIRDYAAEHRDRKTEGRQVVTHLLFLRGGTASDSGDSRVLGLTMGYDLVAIFPDNIDAACDQIPLRLGCNTAPIARATLLHEFGHALGLVNRGTPMVHDHEAKECNGRADEKHSSNTASVMYCAVETNQVAILFNNGPPQDFDNDDRADLRAVREK